MDSVKTSNIPSSSNLNDDGVEEKTKTTKSAGNSPLRISLGHQSQYESHNELTNTTNTGISIRHNSGNGNVNEIKDKKFTDNSDENNDDDSLNELKGKQKISTGMAAGCPTTIMTYISKTYIKQTFQKIIRNSILRKISTMPLSILIFLLFKRYFLNPSVLESFFAWMETHPNKGMAAYLIIYPFHMLLLIPGTPLVMGAGYVFKLRFGWLWGVAICSFITLLGSLIGSVMCFLLGRYCMRGIVRRWSKKYPMFEAIDAAVSDNSFKIMSLLYLTPVMPLGPLSYVMGTTSMPLMAFAKAKIAALPLTVLYVYLGAATGTLVAGNESDENLNGNSPSEMGNNSTTTGEEVKRMSISSKVGELKVDPKMIVFGILLSIVSIVLISFRMKQELQKIIDKQSKEDEEVLELIHGNGVSIKKVTNTKNVVSRTRQRHKTPAVKRVESV